MKNFQFFIKYTALKPGHIFLCCPLVVFLNLTTLLCNTGYDLQKPIKQVTIENKLGMKAVFTSNGARLSSLLVPDKNGKLIDVVIGFENPTDYDNATEPYFGATIGRFGNRISRGKFNLEGVDYQLTINNGPNSLHGGRTGFQYQQWHLEKTSDTSLVCTLNSPDGDNGFPGMLKVKVTYSLSRQGEIIMDYQAITDKTTIVNLTNHAFFNLNGSGSILNHLLTIRSDLYTPIDSVLIPTGKLEEVKNTPFDFRKAKAIGKEIAANHQQLKYGGGYDHNFVLKQVPNQPVATVIGDVSGVRMEVYTQEPGLQFYSGNFMEGKNKLRNGTDDYRTAFCLETQHFPDSPNHADFPSTVLKSGEIYHTRSVYRFSVVK